MLLKVAEKMCEFDFYIQNRQQLDGKASWSNLSLVNRSVGVSPTPLTHTHMIWGQIKRNIFHSH